MATDRQAVSELIRKAESAGSADEALKYSQAACNVAHALGHQRGLASAPLNKK